jgi:hypothetical protein
MAEHEFRTTTSVAGLVIFGPVKLEIVGNCKVSEQEKAWAMLFIVVEHRRWIVMFTFWKMNIFQTCCWIEEAEDEEAFILSAYIRE